LVLEDESSIRGFIVINLTRAGYEVIESETGEEALEKLRDNPDIRVALLDIMLPGIDGFEVCRRIRATNTRIGIIMLTARSQEMDKVTGLMTGADDYVTKPFSPAELTARVDALFRRYGLRPPILLETDSLEVAKRTALGTGSCMLCSDIYVDGMVRRRGAFYPLRDYENHRHFYACYPKGGALPQYAAGFIRIVKQVLEQRER
jgi:DNA-binding response OmpR family regulator